ncbi:GNAT family N-acetyltransferase [Bacillus alkalicellulosilyticus]|uniref:GNAT family N-acetyltransferase n=1 Tax=Alkalihalobacterium alkalicellulosilyticum TaxID=1912214 RepID=UPI000997168E|nr:GNAT family protein [Bacillus alkalicellulosilyticus]
MEFMTEHLLVRNIEIEDKEGIFQLYSDPKVLQLDTSEGIKSVEEAELFIRQIQSPYLNYNSIRSIVIHKESGDTVGTCGFRNWDKNSNHAEIGGNLQSKYWGKGFASELVPPMLSYGFTQLNLNKIYAYTVLRNKAVLRLLEKNHFIQEGLLRKHHLIGNQYEDVAILSKSHW